MFGLDNWKGKAEKELQRRAKEAKREEERLERERRQAAERAEWEELHNYSKAHPCQICGGFGNAIKERVRIEGNEGVSWEETVFRIPGFVNCFGCGRLSHRSCLHREKCEDCYRREGVI